MKMNIVGIEYENNHIYITGNTSIGSIKGEWCCKDCPTLGTTYFFELNIGELDRNDVSVIFGEQVESCVYCSGNQVWFKGICEEIDDVYIIRFSNDWIEMISIKDDDFSIKKGDMVLFSIAYDSIGVYTY